MILIKFLYCHYVWINVFIYFISALLPLFILPLVSSKFCMECREY